MHVTDQRALTHEALCLRNHNYHIHLQQIYYYPRHLNLLNVINDCTKIFWNLNKLRRYQEVNLT